MNYRPFIFPILAATIACAVTRYYWPRIDTKTVTNTQIVEKNHTITRIVEQNGTKTITIDSTVSAITSKNQTKTAFKSPQWRIGALVGTSTAKLTPEYGLELQKRLAGPLFVSVLYINSTAAAQIGLEF